MKIIHHLILGLSALLLVAACGPSRYTSSSFNLASVPEYAFIQPYSYIVLYGDDGKGYYNEESSATATRLISTTSTVRAAGRSTAGCRQSSGQGLGRVEQ